MLPRYANTKLEEFLLHTNPTPAPQLRPRTFDFLKDYLSWKQGGVTSLGVTLTLARWLGTCADWLAGLRTDEEPGAGLRFGSDVVMPVGTYCLAMGTG